MKLKNWPSQPLMYQFVVTATKYRAEHFEIGPIGPQKSGLLNESLQKSTQNLERPSIRLGSMKFNFRQKRIDK